MLIRVGYIGDDPQERDFHFVSKDFSELPSIPVEILQKIQIFQLYNRNIYRFFKIYVIHNGRWKFINKICKSR